MFTKDPCGRWQPTDPDLQRSLRAIEYLSNGHDFCAFCGTELSPLTVHGLEGAELLDPDPTLITVCSRHVQRLEDFTAGIVGMSWAARRNAALLLLSLLGDRCCEFTGERLARKGGRR